MQYRQIQLLGNSKVTQSHHRQIRINQEPSSRFLSKIIVPCYTYLSAFVKCNLDFPQTEAFMNCACGETECDWYEN